MCSLNFVTVALIFVTLPDADVAPRDRRIARRYLSLVNRRRILVKAMRRAERRARRETLLGQIPFTAPLSVAGCSSRVIVQAENMRTRGIPIAFELDDKKQHRGTSIDDAVQAVEVETGAAVGELELLELCEAYVMASRIENNPQRRLARIPRLIERIQSEARGLEEQMVNALRAGDVAREAPMFTVVVDRCLLVEAMERSQKARKGRAVVVGCGKRFAIDGQPLPSIWFRGEGLAVLDRRSISAVLRYTTSEAIGIRCGLETWTAWPSDDAQPIENDQPTPPGMVMSYYKGKRS
jgi:hypothetical protein